jgi:CDP-2,3-bis-(O-geranylgeranyl)-sn-glycerol synthase
LQDFVFAIYIIAPVYCTNGAPVLFGGGMPIDGGVSLADGQRIFGDHKTIRGFLSGLIIGAIVGVFESIFVAQNLTPMAILASLGAMLGDLLAAFVKRRLGIRPGGSLPVLDQLDFVFGALLFVSLLYRISFGTVLIVVLVTPPIHFLTNLGAYVLRLKSTYW